MEAEEAQEAKEAEEEPMRFAKPLLVACRWSLVAAWRWLRAVLEDDAYERYVTRGPRPFGFAQGKPATRENKQSQSTRHKARLSPSDFYLSRLQHKYSRPQRCC